MIPVDQEFFYKAEPRVYGDCTRAVIASLLELPLSDVPHFLRDAGGRHYEYYSAIDKFLEPRGFEMIWSVILDYYWKPGDPDMYHYISGLSPRSPDVHHACVGLNGKIVHDPHPSRQGLLGDPKTWSISVLRPISLI